MKLRDWFDRDQTAARLVAASMRPTSAEGAAALFVQSATACEEAGVDRAEQVAGCWVPGRIEVLGKHTDYCGGTSLLAAAERGFAMIAARRDDNVIQVIDVQRGETAQVSPTGSIDSQAGHWSNYPRTVARRLAKNFPTAAHGATIAFASNLPPSAGMSSSSALIVGTFLVLAELRRLFEDERFRSHIDGREDLAGYLGTVENGSSFGSLLGDRGVGTFGGSEDHTAILCGQPGQLVQYSFCPVRYERSIALADRYVFAIASSGVIAEKTGAAQDKYNRLALLAKEIVEQWQHRGGAHESSLAAILASSPDGADRLRQVLERALPGAFLKQELLDRLDQFEVETRVIASLPVALDPTTIGEFAALVRRSQDAAERFLGNQTPETVHLVNSALQMGAFAASAFGAGFGGSVWAIIEAEDEVSFLTRWRHGYAKCFADRMSRSAFFASRPGPPAT